MRVTVGGFLALLSLLLVIPGCQYDPYASSFTTTKPKDADLVGTYTLTEHSSWLVKERGGYGKQSASITIGDDGTLRFTDVPDWWSESAGKPGGQYDNAPGHWKVERRQKQWWMLSASFEKGALARWARGFIAQVQLVGEKPPYMLHLTIGDPDSGEAMQFEKVAPRK